jgi:F-type H+-transporting ATPase subunit delta
MGAAANRYARALIDVLYPDRAEAGLEQLRTFKATLEQYPDARRIFENPTFSADSRQKVLQKIGAELQWNPQVANFVNLLIERNRLDILEEIITAYQRFLDERMGIVRAVVTSAQTLDAGQEKELNARLEKVTGKKVLMQVVVDASLIGGVVAQVGSTIYDGSIRQQLQTFRDRLAEK